MGGILGVARVVGNVRESGIIVITGGANSMKLPEDSDILGEFRKN